MSAVRVVMVELQDKMCEKVSVKALHWRHLGLWLRSLVLRRLLVGSRSNWSLVMKHRWAKGVFFKVV